MRYHIGCTVLVLTFGIVFASIALLIFLLVNHNPVFADVGGCGCDCGKVIPAPCTEEDCNQACGYTTADQLLRAAYWGKTDKVNALLAEGVDINAKNNGGWTALMLALTGGYSDIVKLLIEKGANVNARTRGGETALIFAARMGEADVVNLLIKNGADVNAYDKSGNTVLMFAASSPKSSYVDIVRALIEKGADINAQNDKGSTALMAACGSGYSLSASADVVRILIEKGANLNLTDYSGVTALRHALFSKSDEIMDIASHCGVKRSEQERELNEIIRLLKQAGAKE